MANWRRGRLGVVMDVVGLVVGLAFVASDSPSEISSCSRWDSHSLSTINGWIGVLLLFVIAPAFYAYMQSGLNGAWKREPAASPTSGP